MTRERWIWLVVIAFLVILAILFLSGVFGGKKQDNTYFDLWMKEKEAKEKLEVEIRENLEERVNALEVEKDSLLSRLADNQPKYIINEKRLADVPVIIRDLSKDELRRRTNQ